MNEIRVKRMVLGGLTMFVVWIAIELLVEQAMARWLPGYRAEEAWPQMAELPDWGAGNYLLNILVALLNSTLLIWIYASLRPMYGVGTRTALITSAFGVFWVFLLFVNLANLGLVPLEAGLAETAFMVLEMPVAMIAGAGVYEGTRPESPV